MALILSIETATAVCSVAIASDGNLLALKESADKNSHSSVITLFIEDVLYSSGRKLTDIDAVAVSEGPGSYTGLRIGVATAKGLCHSLDRPLIGIPTLQAMATGMRENLRASFFCPLIDARRMEVYSAVYDISGNPVRQTEAEILDESSFREFLGKGVVVFGGDGTDKGRTILGKHPNAILLNDFRASAQFMVKPAEEKYSQQTFENLAYFEPFYFKDFIAGKPRVKGLK